MNRHPYLWTTLLALTACSFTNKDDAPTIKSLEGRVVPIERSTAVADGREKAIAGYRDFLNRRMASTPPH